MKRVHLMWPVLLIFVLSFSLVSCGGGGGGGGTTGGTGGDPSTIPTGSGDGSSASPAVLSVGSSSGSIGLGGQSYYSFTPQSTGFYTIIVSGATTSLGWILYSDAGFTGVVKSCSSYTSPTLAAFANLTGGTTYYLRVNNYSTSSGSFYTVNVTAGGGNEGSIDSPAPLAVATPHSATISSDGTGYYYFTADRDGSFIISLTNTHQDLRWSLYSNASYTAYVVFPCDTTSSAGDETCSTPNLAAGQKYYLKVEDRDYIDGFFTIIVSPGASEGSPTGPVSLAVGSSHVGGVGGSGGTSYYAFTTDANNTSSYNIILSSVTPTATLSIAVYSDPAFSYGSEVKTCYQSTQCLASGLGPATAYYVKVTSSGGYNSSPACTYSIVVSPGGSEGSPASPIGLTAGQARTATVDGYSSSYYSFTTANNGVGGSYTISLTNTQTNLGWTLYSNAGFSSGFGACDNVTTAGAGDETCATTNLDPNTTYYLKVSNAEGAASSYTLQVVPGGGDEGSRNYPYPLTAGAAHNGYVLRYDNSYYKFTTGPTAMTYRISLTNMQTNLGWRLYSDAGFTTDISPVCSMGTGTADKVCSTTQSSYGVLNANTTYYLMVESNTSGNISSPYAIKVESLDPASGCSGGAAECFNFQDGLLPASFVLTYPGNQSTKWGIDSTNNATTGSAGSSMKSGPILGGQQTCFEYTRIGTGSIYFSLKTDAASTSSLVFYLNNNPYHYWYGAAPWRRVWFDTAAYAGASTVYKWCYQKDSGVVAGADAVWVDDIEFK